MDENDKGIVLLIFCVLCVNVSTLRAQNAPEYDEGLRINFNDTEDYFIRFMIWNQTWARLIENNPGTLINGVPEDRNFDIGARRMRLLVMAQLPSRFMVMAHIGANNQTFLNGGAAGSGGTGVYGAGKRPGMFFHDFTSEYTVMPAIDPSTNERKLFSMTIGVGLHYCPVFKKAGLLCH